MTFTNAANRMTGPYDFMPLMPILESGGLILYPTDTIWSIGCDAANPEAIGRIREIRKMKKDSVLEILVSGIEMLKEYIPDLHPRIETLLLFHTRPVTIIYENSANLPHAANLETGSVAVRLVKDDFCKELIAAHGAPLIAASAHAEGSDFPRFFGEISSEIISGVDKISEYRRWDKKPGQPAVMAQMDERDELEFLRE